VSDGSRILSPRFLEGIHVAHMESIHENLGFAIRDLDEAAPQIPPEAQEKARALRSRLAVAQRFVAALVDEWPTRTPETAERIRMELEADRRAVAAMDMGPILEALRPLAGRGTR
jgi:hypothetical protein